MAGDLQGQRLGRTDPQNPHLPELCNIEESVEQADSFSNEDALHLLEKKGDLIPFNCGQASLTPDGTKQLSSDATIESYLVGIGAVQQRHKLRGSVRDNACLQWHCLLDTNDTSLRILSVCQ